MPSPKRILGVIYNLKEAHLKRNNLIACVPFESSEVGFMTFHWRSTHFMDAQA